MATASPRHRAAPAARLLAAALGTAFVMALASCTSSAPHQQVAKSAGEPHGTLTGLAGSELKDVVPLLGQVRNATGVNLAFDYAGTLDGAERIATCRAGADLAWFSSVRYLTLLTSR